MTVDLKKKQNQTKINQQITIIDKIRYQNQIKTNQLIIIIMKNIKRILGARKKNIVILIISNQSKDIQLSMIVNLIMINILINISMKINKVMKN